jgi:hypothetical protein
LLRGLAAGPGGRAGPACSSGAGGQCWAPRAWMHATAQRTARHPATPPPPAGCNHHITLRDLQVGICSGGRVRSVGLTLLTCPALQRASPGRLANAYLICLSVQRLRATTTSPSNHQATTTKQPPHHHCNHHITLRGLQPAVAVARAKRRALFGQSQGGPGRGAGGAGGGTQAQGGRRGQEEVLDADDL